MDITTWYSSHFESRLRGRYITNEDIFRLLDTYTDLCEISVLGTSEMGKEISLIKLGTGKKKVLAWSQMHGNESTTTKALFDFLKFLIQKEFFQDEIRLFLERFTLFAIPMLNPDGATFYTRENANSVDLNRDAKDLSQRESVVLHTVFNDIQPDLCLNLHDQRTIYGLDNGLPATISFLAPAADPNKNVTAARQLAMEAIVRMSEALQKYIPGQVGRYDDTYNENCVGDTFQSKEVATILFEAGHYNGDYQREETRKFIFYAFLELFGITDNTEALANYKEYFNIPENRVNYKDCIIRNVRYNGSDIVSSIAIQYSEVLEGNSVKFVPVVDALGGLEDFYGHKEVDGKGAPILINSQQYASEGEKILTIVNKNDDSIVFFP